MFIPAKFVRQKHSIMNWEKVPAMTVKKRNYVLQVQYYLLRDKHIKN